MPLWLQGIVELVFTAALSFGLVLVLLMAVWFTNGFNRMDFPALATLASHLWLLMHGVPLNIPNAFGIILPHGMLTLVPMGLSIIPVLLCFRSGRKLARASYEGEFFKPVLLGCAAYGIFAAVAFAWASTERHLLGIVGAALIPQIVVLVGLIWGGYYESRSLARMVGVNTAEQISQMSQYSRWASSYVWSIVRASMVAIFSLIMGGVKDRDGQVRQFQNDPAVQVFIGQIATAGMGLTLTAASTMVFYSLDYSMSNYEQCRARIHRAGQKFPCTYIHLIAKGTVDGKVMQALKNKANLAKSLIDDWRKGNNPFEE